LIPLFESLDLLNRYAEKWSIEGLSYRDLGQDEDQLVQALLGEVQEEALHRVELVLPKRYHLGQEMVEVMEKWDKKVKLDVWTIGEEGIKERSHNLHKKDLPALSLWTGEFPILAGFAEREFRWNAWAVQQAVSYGAEEDAFFLYANDPENTIEYLSKVHAWIRKEGFKKVGSSKKSIEMLAIKEPATWWQAIKGEIDVKEEDVQAAKRAIHTVRSWEGKEVNAFQANLLHACRPYCTRYMCPTLAAIFKTLERL